MKKKAARSQGLTRRDFAKCVAGISASALFVSSTRGLSASVDDLFATTSSLDRFTRPKSKQTWMMVIDQSKCIGCNFCTFACKAVNDVPTDAFWNVVFTERRIADSTVFLPRPCMHCDEPPCVEVCPVGATFKRDDGIVGIDYDKCIGCRYCVAACPYGARYFNWKEFVEENSFVPEWGHPEVGRRPRGVVEKCTFCAHRIDKGLENGLKPGVDVEATPACVNVCPARARYFGDIDDVIASPIWGELPKLMIQKDGRRLRDELGTEPRVIYLAP